VLALTYEFLDRKLIARFQNRIGPRWYQTVADIVKLLIKEEITPATAHPTLFGVLPVVAMSGVLTAALYVPLLGFPSAFGFKGDLIVTLYLLSLITMCIGVAGWNSTSRFTMVGATRAFTEYSGRGLGFFHLAKEMELVVGMTLIAALYMGGIANPLEFFIKTLILLAILASLHCVLTRLRIDQTVGLWWRYGAAVVLLQWLVLIAWRGMVA